MSDPPGKGPEPLFDAVIRRAAQLDRATSSPVKRMRVQTDAETVEVEWWPGPAGADAPPPVPSDGVSGSREAPEEAEKASTISLDSPAVGTFYHAPEPGAEPFVQTGDAVEAGQQVGILEAMKLMNAIEAEQDGRVVEILVPNETPVEYGQPLMLLAPSDSV